MRLLFVCHCPSENTARLRTAALQGIESLGVDQLDMVARSPQQADASDVQSCDAIIIGTTENFGAMAGLTKDFFERIYYPCLEATIGLPMVLYIRAGEDGRGTRTGLEKIATGLRWRPVAETLILRGAYRAEFDDQVAELAMTLAAGLDAEIF